MIQRTLAYQDPSRGQVVVREDDIASIVGPVVILGDPGLGKTRLTRRLDTLPNMSYVRAGTFVRTGALGSRIKAGARVIVVDGLDEIASAAPGGAVEDVLRQLSALGNPRFILSCREADWLGAADRVRIMDDYGVAPVVLHLQPFTFDDARTFLSEDFPDISVDGVLGNLARRGIQDIQGNPLTLRMLGEIARDKGPFPETRAQLLDRSCRVMLKEKNPRHSRQSYATRSEEQLLLAAGAICATQLLCGRIGIYTGPHAETPAELVNITDVADLPFGEAAHDALRLRLFQAEGESRFTHIHRVIAEFLGAKWIAKCFDTGVSQRRIFALFRRGQGVPSSLRGLHAWMAHFSGGLARRCIDVDPYAVLRYGDAEELDLNQARSLIASLKKLSEEDPYFRSEDWGRHPASGLMRVELKNDIVAIIETSRQHRQLTVLLLEAMFKTELSRTIAPELREILLDRNRSILVRLPAVDAISAAAIEGDWEALILRLLQMNDADSARLAYEILERVGTPAVSTGTIVDVVLAYGGLAADQDPRSELHMVPRVSDSLIGDLDTGQLAIVLDGVVEGARPLMETASYSANSYGTDLVIRLAVQFLATGSAIDPGRLWGWIGWLNRRDSDREMRTRLAGTLGDNPVVRAALVRHVLLTPCGDNTWMAGHRLYDIGLDYPTAEDVAQALHALGAQAGGKPIDPDTWRQLLRFQRSSEGLPAVVCDAANEAANGNHELLAILAEMSKMVVPEWEIREEERRAHANAAREAKHQSYRDDLAGRAADIAAGDFRVLALSADVYLDRYYVLPRDFRFDSDASPEERVRAFLGKTLSEQVLLGFVAVLRRSDLPSAFEIAQSHCENQYWKIEAPMICGIAEMLRRGSPIDTIDRDTLAAVYMALQQAPRSSTVGQIDIGSAVEAVLFQNDVDRETHFRTSIEPRLARGASSIPDLYRFTRDPVLADVAGRLAVEWLRTYPGLSAPIQTDLLTCALKNSPHETIRTLRAGIGTTTSQDQEMRRLWLSVDYVVNFESCREALATAAAEDPSFLWSIRNRIETGRGERLADFSIGQLFFVLEAFGTHWSKCGHPATVSHGNCNPWDATDFIERTIHAIARGPSPEATDALRKLIADHAPTYADTAKHALALQLRTRRDSEYASPTVSQLQSVMANDLPETVDDMRAYFADRIQTLQERMRGSNTDMWEAYWSEDARPRQENFCRNRLIEHISGQLPPSIRFEPETHMPGQTRADIAAICNTIGLPVEIKGQWHRGVWNAASDQLDAQYARDWRACGRGVYIVLWFGDASGRRLPAHPEGLERPATPERLRQMLIDRLPEERRPLIDIMVIDVTKLNGVA